MNSKKTLIITGSLGLIGYESTVLLLKKGYRVIGIDNNFRKKALGIYTNYDNKLSSLHKIFPESYIHYSYNLCKLSDIEKVFKLHRISTIIHTAGQTSHDWATNNAYIDCQENIFATLNLLELTRKYSPKSTFIFTSTNKVYGDLINTLPYKTLETRYDLHYSHPMYSGVSESFSTDQSLHSLFGVSKLSADMYVQEYGRHFGMNTTCFRLGVVAGRGQNGALEQGFLSYLLKQILDNKPIKIIGYKGKQVRDIIAASDVAAAFYSVIKNPKIGAVYNLGGGRNNAYSVLEIIKKIQKYSKNKVKLSVNNTIRSGDHKWWISNYSKFTNEYPYWKITKSIDHIIQEMIQNSYD